MPPLRRVRSLYICYLSLEDPLVHTQVVAYLRGLAAAGHELHLLTFETEPLTKRRRARWREVLAADSIVWHGLRYHKRPSLPATVFDVLVGAAYAAFLVVRHRLDVLHARSHVPAAMALIARVPFRTRRPLLIFDIRGLMAEEYEDAGRWDRQGIPFRLTKWVERRAIARASGIVVLTNRVRRLLFGDDPAEHVSVIPCCADLDALTKAHQQRARSRDELAVGDATVMIYVGKFGGWYMGAEMAEFFAVARRVIPGLRFVIMTQVDPAEIERELSAHALPDGSYTIGSVGPERLGAYLAAADIGIGFIRPAPSKISSSPTKIGEYLGSGLPVITTAGVGDLDAIIGDDVGVLVDAHTEAAYVAAAQAASDLARQDRTGWRCRAIAEREFSLAEVGIPRYRALYDHVASQLPGGPPAPQLDDDPRVVAG